eukprot:m.152741 g.152741  ORF g.152741 m.152741 type:complete len:359 (-) comp16219_c1_seq1:149-1225(-)
MTGTRRAEPTISEMINKYSEALSSMECDRFGRKPPTRVLWGIQTPAQDVIRSLLHPPVVEPTALTDASSSDAPSEPLATPPPRQRRPRAPRVSRRPSVQHPLAHFNHDLLEAQHAEYATLNMAIETNRSREDDQDDESDLSQAQGRDGFSEHPADRKHASLPRPAGRTRGIPTKRLSLDELPALRSRSVLQSDTTYPLGQVSPNTPYPKANHPNSLPPLGPPCTRSLPNVLELVRQPALNASPTPSPGYSSASTSPATRNASIAHSAAVNSAFFGEDADLYVNGNAPQNIRRQSSLSLGTDAIDSLFNDDAAFQQQRQKRESPIKRRSPSKPRQQEVFTFDPQTVDAYQQRIRNRLMM